MQKEIEDMQKIMLRNVENYTTKNPDDYVLATGKQYSIRQFVNMVCKKLI